MRSRTTLGGGVVAALGALALPLDALAQQAVQWRVEVGGNGHWYGITQSPLGETHWTFAVAQEIAVRHGGMLASFESPTENDVVLSIVSNQIKDWSIAWFGLIQKPGSSEPDGGWGWLSGDSLTYTRWESGEPTNSACWLGYPQDWGMISRFSVLWDDRGEPGPGCWAEISAAIIEWSADCNADGLVDYGQILDGSVPDANGNGVPDTCECLGDLTRDGRIDGFDLSAVLASWGVAGSGKFDADVTGDGVVDFLDLAVVLGGWGECPP